MPAKPLHQTAVPEARIFSHADEIGESLREIVRRDMRAGLLEKFRRHVCPGRAHHLHIAFDTMFSGLTFLANHIHDKEPAAGGETSGAGLKKRMLSRARERMHRKAAEDEIELLRERLRGLEHIAQLQFDTGKSVEIATRFLQGRR